MLNTIETLSNALERLRADQSRYLEELLAFLRIPSISTLPAHRPDILRAAEWLATDMQRIGLHKVQVMATAGNPVVYGEWLDAGPDAPTILIYGHYDVQPPDPVALWQSPPFEPQIRDGRLYARGASDNKGQMFAHLKAIETMLAANGRLPLNVKVAFDGEEEVGSPNLAPFVAGHKALLAADSVVISDGPMLTPGQPAIVYAMRGVMSLELRVKGPKRDLHSGVYGGSVLNPAQVVAQIIAALHDTNGTVAIPGFYDRVLPLSPEEKRLLARVPDTLSEWQAQTGLATPWGESEFSLLERVSVRPTCEVNGLWGGWQGEGSKTIIPAEAGAKISMRLVAEQDPDEVAGLFKAYVHDLTPADVQVEINIFDGAAAAVTPFPSPQIEAAVKAYQAVWDVEPVLSRLGGSLPIVVTFQKELGLPFVLMPFGLDDNRHAPNEHLRLEYFERGIATAVHFYHYLAEIVER